MLEQLLRIYKNVNPNELSLYQFRELEKEIKSKNSRTISDEYVDFKLWMQGLPSRQENFASFLEKRIPKKEGMKILEVGCGRTGRLSRILVKKGLDVTGIDPKVEMLNCDNTKFIRGKFEHTKFELSAYDFVIAQEPCDATEHIIRACVKQRVPFIISLCGVPHKTISGFMPKNEKEWYQYLLKISAKDLELYYIKLDPLTITPILKSNF